MSNIIHNSSEFHHNQTKQTINILELAQLGETQTRDNYAQITAKCYTNGPIC